MEAHASADDDESEVPYAGDEKPGAPVGSCSDLQFAAAVEQEDTVTVKDFVKHR
jgi:hypothetical protein